MRRVPRPTAGDVVGAYRGLIVIAFAVPAATAAIVAAGVVIVAAPPGYR